MGEGAGVGGEGVEQPSSRPTQRRVSLLRSTFPVSELGIDDRLVAEKLFQDARTPFDNVLLGIDLVGEDETRGEATLED